MPRVLAHDPPGNGSATITSMASRHASDLLRRDLLPEYITLGWNFAESVVRALETGVDTIEHASFTGPAGMPQFDMEIASRIKDKGIVVGPTAISGIRIAHAIRASNSHGPSSSQLKAASSSLEPDRA